MAWNKYGQLVPSSALRSDNYAMEREAERRTAELNKRDAEVKAKRVSSGGAPSPSKPKVGIEELLQ